MKNRKLKVGLATGSILTGAFVAIAFFASLIPINASINPASECSEYCKKYLACAKEKDPRACVVKLKAPKNCYCATPQ